jgi:hypothetical protein
VIRRLFLALLLFVLFGGATVWFAEGRAVDRAESMGIQWDSMERSLGSHRFEGVRWKQFRLASVEVPWRLPLRAEARGMDLDLSTFVEEGGSSSSAMPDMPELPDVNLSLEGVSLRWEEHPIAESLSGTWNAAGLALAGEGLTLGIQEGRVSVRARASSPLQAVEGVLDLILEVEADGTGSLSLSSERLGISHPLVAPTPLVLEEVSAHCRLDVGELAVDGLLTAGSLELQMEAQWTGDGLDFQVELPRSSAENALRPLVSIVPELEDASVEGSIEGVISGNWPGGITRLEGDLVDLRVDGAAHRPESLRRGPFQYRVRSTEDGMVIRSSGEGTRHWSSLDSVAESLKAAVVAAEDSRFWDHSGYDMAAMREALAADLEEGAIVRGGSTLTQQLAKNLYLDGSRTLQRKLRELVLAVELERVLGKERVLELYLNVVEWGPEIHGIAEATERYFMRSPEMLFPHESAFLAAILPAPRDFYDRWYLRGRGSQFRIGWVFQNMVDGEVMTWSEAARWRSEPLVFVPPPQEEAPEE